MKKVATNALAVFICLCASILCLVKAKECLNERRLVMYLKKRAAPTEGESRLLMMEYGATKVTETDLGIYVVLKETDFVRSGIYSPKENLKPEDGSGITFEEVEGGIYRFEEKMRRRAISK